METSQDLPKNPGSEPRTGWFTELLKTVEDENMHQARQDEVFKNKHRALINSMKSGNGRDITGGSNTGGTVDDTYEESQSQDTFDTPLTDAQREGIRRRRDYL